MTKSSWNSVPLPALALFTALILSLSFGVREVSAEGERYERLEITVPEARAEKTEEMEQEVSSAKVLVIASAFTRANRNLDQAQAARYGEHILEAAERFGVHPFMVASIIIRESTVKQNARSRYAYGLMQVNWKAHRKGLKAAFNHIQTLDDLLQPRNNILAGTWIFSWYLRSCGGSTDKALAKYLGRSGKKYIKRVLALYNEMLGDFEKIKKRAMVTLDASHKLVAFAVE